MVDFLSLVHFIEHLLFDMTISPTKVKVHATNRVRDHRPLKFFRYLPNNSILSFFVLSMVPAILTIILGKPFRKG